MCRSGVDVDTVRVDAMNSGSSGAGISHIVAGSVGGDLGVMAASQSQEPPYSSWKEVVLSCVFWARHTSHAVRMKIARLTYFTLGKDENSVISLRVGRNVH